MGELIQILPCQNHERHLKIIRCRFLLTLTIFQALFGVHKLFHKRMHRQRHLRYVHSCDLDEFVQIKIGQLEGELPRPPIDDVLQPSSDMLHCVTCVDKANEMRENSDIRESGDPLHSKNNDGGRRNMFVTVSVYSTDEMVGVPMRTAFKHFASRYAWNEWITLPVKYSELARDARAVFTVCDVHTDPNEPHAVAGTSLNLFSKRAVFRNGIYDLYLWPFVEGDSSIPSSTPGKVPKSQSPDTEMGRLGKLAKRHHAGHMPKVDWLDRLAFREIELINEKEKRKTRSLYLMVEFATVMDPEKNPHIVVFYENDLEPTVGLVPTSSNLIRYFDPELGMENLAESKHHIVSRSTRRGRLDRTLKPTATARDMLEKIIAQPTASQPLTAEQRDLVWGFRYYLSSNGKALSKFLRSVHWTQTGDVAEALHLLHAWAPMDVEDALELLLPEFDHPAVRRYAVARLARAPNDDLLAYLLQLVQALKYEPQDGHTEADKLCAEEDDSEEPLLNGQPSFGDTPSATDPYPDLATFLISAACKDSNLANYLYWYLKVENDAYKDVSTSLHASIAPNTDTPSTSTSMHLSTWREDRVAAAGIYASVLRRLSLALHNGGPAARKRRAQLAAQEAFVERIIRLMESVRSEAGGRQRKIDYLRAQLGQTTAAAVAQPTESQPGSPSPSGTGENVDFAHLSALPLPLDPSVKVEKILAKNATIFNSSLMPIKLVFETVDGERYSAIFKSGDDLRQDQLVIQMISLMDKLLRADNLDLRLTPYRVLATGLDHGLVQFIDSMPLRNVLHEWGSVMDYLRYHRPQPSGPCGVEPEVMANYVRSVAGYTVITYVLGVGDRHLHNILLCQNGKMFHIDFGYFLGRDPKVMPPPMKLTEAIIDGMGGRGSPQWDEFLTLAITAFLHLRRHANLLLNLFALMRHASIPDIALEPDKAVRKLEERLHLSLSDEEVVALMHRLIDASVNAKMAALADLVHDWAIALRN